MASNLFARSAISWAAMSRTYLQLSKIVVASSATTLSTSHKAVLSSNFQCLNLGRSMSTGTTASAEPPREHKPVEDSFNRSQESSSENKNSSNRESEFDEDQVKKTILLKALDHVAKHGFTMEAIELGSMDAGLSSSAKNMFENGEFDLIDFFYKKCNADVNEFMENQLNSKQKPIKTNEFIRSALIHRLKLLQPLIEHWPNAMAVQTFKPQNAVKSFNNLLSLCDDIWYHAGDKSTDMNWYSKRLILASLYKSTELYMLQDKSPEFVETIKFLDNRFQDLSAFYKLNSELTNIKEGIKGSFTVLKNIMNLK